MPLTYEIIEKLREVIPGYNVRALTLADFEALCARDGIIVVRAPDARPRVVLRQG